MGGRILGSAFLFSLAAFWNGFPLIFEDSARYIDGGLRHYLPSQSPIFYGVFLWPFEHFGRFSLWPVVLVQGLIAAHLIARTLRHLGISTQWLPGIALVLTLGSSLPWFTGFIMPDFFTPILVLALYLLAFARAELGRGETLYFWLLATAAIAMHLSHLPLGFALALGLILLTRERASMLWLVTPPLLALTAVLGMNVAAKGRIMLSEDGPVFAFARLFADGPAKTVMIAECPTTHWALCRALPDLPADSDAILWDRNSPFWQAAPRPILRREAATIVSHTLATAPGLLALTAAQQTIRQFLTTASTADLRSFAGADEFIQQTLERDLPATMPAFLAAAQQQQTLPQAWIDEIDLAVLLISAGAIPFLTGLAWRRGQTAYPALVATMLLALIGNAAATGALSSVHPRYQARLIWLVPFTAAAGFALSRRRIGHRIDNMEERAHDPALHLPGLAD